MTTTLLSSSAAVAGADAAEIDGYRRLWAAPSPLLAARAGIVHRDVDGVHCAAVTAWRNGRPVTHALGFEGGDETLVKIERFYRALAIVPRVGLPEGHPAEADLERRGYQRDTGWTKFLRGTEPASAPATDLRVRPVRPADAERYDEIVRTALGFPDMVRGWFAQFPFQPGVHCLGAYDGDLLVGTGTLVVHGDHADMTWGATAPEHRGRGAQGALMAARIDLARRLGVTTIGTATGLPGPDGPGPSHRNMLRAGFEPVHVRRWWQRRT